MRHRSWRTLRWLVALALVAGALAHAQRIGLITFNDVYELQPVDGGSRGGAARVATVVHRAKAVRPATLVLFAGDLLSPSVMSTAFQGRQMVEALNRLGVDYATFGNHEFDFGLDTLKQRIRESQFVWLSANIVESASGEPIEGSRPDALVDVGGAKVGIFGLAYDFSSILADASSVSFADPIATARNEVAKLRDAGADIVVALTHEAHAQDCQLSAEVPGIDLIVGGHDHAAMMNTQCGGAPLVKATSDWRDVWSVHVDLGGASPDMTFEDLPVTAAVPPDPGMAALVQRFADQLDRTFATVLGASSVDLNAVEADVRATETNLGDFIADAVREATGADVALMNGGGIRTDRVYPAGDITKKDVFGILPFGNKVVVVKATGSVLAAALENGVSQREDLAGRFPQVSGVTFTVSPGAAPGERVGDVKVHGEPLAPDATYEIAINDYMYGGGDGYTMFQGLPTTLSPSEGPLLAEVVAAAVQSAGTIAPRTDGRIVVR